MGSAEEVPIRDPAFIFYSIGALLLILVLTLKVLWPRRKLAPGPRPWPIVGNLYDLKPLRLRLFFDWAQKYGPIFSFWMGTTLNVVVSSAALAKEALKDKDEALAGRPRGTLAKSFSRDGQDLIWADYGPHYVKVRKLCNVELFSPKRLEALRPIREEEVTRMVGELYRDFNAGLEGPLNVKKYLASVAFNNITRIVFGKKFVNENGEVDAQGKEFYEITHQGQRLGSQLRMTEHIAYLRWLFPFKGEALEKHRARRDSLTKAIMQEYAGSYNLSSHSGVNEHFVHALFALQKTYELSDVTVITLLWDMITAGLDTTVIAVEWAMAELIRNPEVQRKAQDELDRVVGYERVLMETDFISLPYLQAITKESLRLHPPTPLLLPHKAMADTTLGGYDVPVGSTVQVNCYAVGRDVSVWEEAGSFRPERFLEEDVDVKGSDCRLLPFGAGRRVCPGAQLALLLTQLMVGRLLHHFTWAPPEGTRPEDIDLTESPGVVTFMARPLQARVHPRLPSALY